MQYIYNNTAFSDATTVCDLGVDVDSSLKYDGPELSMGQFS